MDTSQFAGAVISQTTHPSIREQSVHPSADLSPESFSPFGLSFLRSIRRGDFLFMLLASRGLFLALLKCFS
jgi:hypothetical protein